jgi:hypothetical protein
VEIIEENRVDIKVDENLTRHKRTLDISKGMIFKELGQCKAGIRLSICNMVA